jgi:hypothetical protein
MLRDRHRRLIAVTLEAAAPFGAALGGRNALAVHGLSRQAGKVIDVVTSREAGPQAAAVEQALHRAGYRAARQQQVPELENTWPPARQTATEWHVRTSDPHDHPPIGGVRDYKCAKCFDRDYLGLSRAPRSRDPVQTELGPVLHPEDAAGAKVADLARRGRIRDYAATADLLEHYKPSELIGFARRLDPSLGRQEFADLAQRLDRAPEVAFTYSGIKRPEEVARVKDQFAAWPRDPQQISVGRHQRERAAPGRERPELPNRGTPDSHTTSPPASRTAKNPPGRDRAGTPMLPVGPRRTASPPGAAGNARPSVTAQNSNDDQPSPLTVSPKAPYESREDAVFPERIR